MPSTKLCTHYVDFAMLIYRVYSCFEVGFRQIGDVAEDMRASGPLLDM